MVTSGPTTSPLATPTRGKDSRVKKTKLNTVNVFYVDAVSGGRKNHHLGSGIWHIGLSFFFGLGNVQPTSGMRMQAFHGVSFFFPLMSNTCFSWLAFIILWVVSSLSNDSGFPIITPGHPYDRYYYE